MGSEAVANFEKLMRMATANRVAITLLASGLPFSRDNAVKCLLTLMNSDFVTDGMAAQIGDDILRIDAARDRLLATPGLDVIRPS